MRYRLRTLLIAVAIGPLYVLSFGPAAARKFAGAPPERAGADNLPPAEMQLPDSHLGRCLVVVR